MKEKVYKTRVSDIRLEVTVCDAGFDMRGYAGSVNGIMAQIKHIHQHSTYEIFFVIEGNLNVTDENGEQDFSSCAVVIPPYYNHYTVSSVSNGYCFYFTIEQVPKSGGGVFSALDKKISDSISSFALNERSLFYIENFARAIGEDRSDEEISHILPLLFLELFGKSDIPADQIEAPYQNKYNSYIQAIDRYVSSYAKPSLDELSKELYLCPKQVSRIIKKEYGCSLSELVNRRKLIIACMLLKHTNLSISHIASTVGYEYENYFFTLFKKAYGISPSKYREENK